MPLAVALATLFVATAATGQGVGGIVESLQGSGGRDAALDPRAEEQAIEMARGSFERTVKKAGEEILASQENVSSETTARVESLVSESVDGFLFEVHDELMDAKGDGLLTQSELSEEIQEAREFILEDLRGALQAAIDGASRPPTYEESEGAGDYTLSKTRYIAFERNAPQVWAILAMWSIGAVLCAYAISRFSERFAGGR
jgi:hypothetical protein